MGYNAVNIGDFDFSLGTEFLIKLRQKASFPFISSNILYKDNGDSVFKTHMYLKINGITLGIFGLTSPNGLFPSDIIIADPVPTAMEMVDKLSKKADIILALTDMSISEDIKLAKLVKGINYIIGSGEGSLFHEPRKSGDVLIFKAGNHGKYLGSIKFYITDLNKKITNFTRKNRRINQIDKRLNDLSKNAGDTPLEEYYKNNEKLVEKIINLKRTRRSLLVEKSKIKNYILYNAIPVDQDRGEDRAVQKLVDNFKRKYPDYSSE